jgi:hypothetical protein
MTGNVYVYADSGSDFSIMWGRGVTESDYNAYGHQYRETVTIRSPSGRTASASGGRSTSYSEAVASLPISRSDPGTYEISTHHFEFCPYVDLEWAIGSLIIRPRLGVAFSCWNWDGRLDSDIWGHYRCKYDNLITPCQAECIPPPGVPTYHWDGDCPRTLRWDVLFIIWPNGSRTCAPAGEGFPSSSFCQCGNTMSP